MLDMPEGGAGTGRAAEQVLLDALDDGLVLQDRAGRVLVANPAAERILGAPVSAVTSLDSARERWRMVHPDGSPWPVEEHPVVTTLTTGEPVVGTLIGLHRPDGSLVWLDVTTRPAGAPGPDGLPSAVATSFSDVTGSRETRERVAETRALVDEALRAAGIGLLVEDGGRVLLATDAFATLWGTERPDALAGSAVETLLPALAGATLDPGAVLRDWEGDRDAGAFEPREVGLADGRVLVVAVGALPRTGHRAWVTWDGTDRHRQQREVARARDAAERALLARTALLGEAREGLDAPLAETTALLETLGSRALAADDRPLVHTLRGTVHELAGVLSDLSDVVALEGGAAQVRRQPLDLRDELVRAGRAAHVTARQVGARLLLALYPSATGRVRGDGPRLRQVVAQVARWAVRSAPGGTAVLEAVVEQGADGSLVHVRATLPPGGARLPGTTLRLARLLGATVEQHDAGVSLWFPLAVEAGAPAPLEADGAAVTLTGTPGAVLDAVARSLVAAGAQVTVVDRRRAGPRDADLDVVQATGVLLPGQLVTGWERAEEEHEVPLGALPQGRRVLLVEADPISRTVLRRMLELAGLRCDAVAAPDESLAGAAYDVVLVGLDGLEAGADGLPQSLGTLDGAAPVVPVATRPSPEQRAAWRGAGLVGLLEKPASLRDLHAVLGPLLGESTAPTGPEPRPEPEPVPETDEPVLDLPVLLDLGEQLGDEELLEMVVDTYLGELPSRSERLSAGPDEDLEEFRRVAHSLKSASAMVGAMAVSAVCADLERAVDDERLEDSRRLAAHALTLLRPTARALEEWKAQAGSNR